MDNLLALNENVCTAVRFTTLGRSYIQTTPSEITNAVQRTVSVQVQHIAQQSRNQQEVHLGHDASLASGV